MIRTVFVLTSLIHRKAATFLGLADVEGTPRFRDGTLLSIGTGVCEIGAVKRSNLLCRLLAVLAVVGLIIAPLTARAHVDGIGSMAMMSVSDGAAAMSDDMPCCPDKSAPADCDQCPLMALCAATTLQAPLQVGIAEISPVTLRMLLPGSDPEVDSVVYSPPPRPPRSLVRSA